MGPATRERFQKLFERLGGKAKEHVTIGQTEYARLILKYGTPGRWYHTLAHIHQGLAEIDELLELNLLSEPDVCEYSWWNHDVIMRFAKIEGEPSNEEASAIFAVQMLHNGGIYNPFITATVASIIIATDHTHSPTTSDEQHIVDIDLSIFGQKEEVFDAYERHIRLEYKDVTELLFCTVRRDILQGFLDRIIDGKRRIYYTDYFFNKYEARARANLERSVAALSQKISELS